LSPKANRPYSRSRRGMRGGSACGRRGGGWSGGCAATRWPARPRSRREVGEAFALAQVGEGEQGLRAGVQGPPSISPGTRGGSLQGVDSAGPSGGGAEPGSPILGRALCIQFRNDKNGRASRRQ